MKVARRTEEEDENEDGQGKGRNGGIMWTYEMGTCLNALGRR